MAVTWLATSLAHAVALTSSLQKVADMSFPVITTSVDLPILYNRSYVE